MGKDTVQYEIGQILDGKVTGITKFGAFVSLPGGRSGLVHISEIANTFVNDVHEHLTEGQSVRVKVIGLNDGKINLSIKKAEVDYAPPQRQSAPRPVRKSAEQPPADPSFEDKLKQFMQDSDSRMSGNRLYADRKSRRRRD